MGTLNLTHSLEVVMLLAKRLTGRELARVSRVVAQTVPRDPDMPKAVYLAHLERVARELYPQKFEA